ncbi:MAG: hypothetical protein HFE66_00465 [Clostridiales bacterium]|jgi:hypothetical protein|nr:hypothetical protein [Clostridiales bacterium]
MRIDKKTVDKIAGMPDDRLWKMILSLGASKGIDLSSIKISSVEMDKIRTAMTQMTDEDIVRAMEIIDACKNQ